MRIRFPRGLEVDTDFIPSNFEELILESFKEFTYGTRKEYMYQDKLSWIDWSGKLLHGHPCCDDAVKKLILKNVEWELDECGELPNAEDFWNIPFMATCYEQGQKDTSLYDHFTGNTHTDEIIMSLLARAIKVVMNYEGEDE